MQNTLKIVSEVESLLGEGPCWDDQYQLLYWIDILGKKIHRYDPVTEKTDSINVQQNIGCIALRDKGGMIAALQNGFYFIDFDSCELEFITDPEVQLTGNRFNDGKCDCKGRFWAGTMSVAENDGKGRSAPAGSLYCLNADLSFRKVLSDITISNGLSWNHENKTMYFIDSPTGKVMAFDFEANTGEISNGKVAVRIPECEGIPDGMTIDEEGMLWIAHWGGYKVSRWDPCTGKRLQEIRIPVRNVTSCAFGGKRFDELYITTSSMGIAGERDPEQPDAGKLFKVIPGVKGSAMFRFRSMEYSDL